MKALILNKLNWFKKRRVYTESYAMRGTAWCTEARGWRAKVRPLPLTPFSQREWLVRERFAKIRAWESIWQIKFRISKLRETLIFAVESSQGTKILAWEFTGVRELALEYSLNFAKTSRILREAEICAREFTSKLRKLKPSHKTQWFQGFASGNLREGDTTRAKLDEGENSRWSRAQHPVVLPANCIQIYCILLIHTCRGIHTRKC